MKPIKHLLFVILILIIHYDSQAQSCTGYVTLTQGAWGACANGNNIGNYLNANFSLAFPNGLEIGCTNKLKLSSANAVRNFLPQSSTPKPLPLGTLLNPTSNSYHNILAGQLVTLALNIGFDNYDSNFAPASDQLKDLIIVSGPFASWTVQQLFDEANKKIGGCSLSTLSYSDFNNTINNININYDRGLSNLNFLSCQLHLTECHVNVGCAGGNTGSINLTVHNGNAPFTYNWSNGSTNQDLSNLIAGNYTVIVTDASGTTASLTVTISQPNAFSVSATSTDINCYGYNDGTATLSTNGNGANYSYQWSNGATSNSISNLTSGIYTYTVIDNNGCSQSNSITINEPSALSLILSTTNVTCYGLHNGSIAINTSGGTTPYSYSINSNPASIINNQLAAGTYQVNVTDNNGCNASSTSVITEPDSLNLSGTKTDAYACDQFVCDGTADITINGGISPYTTLWSDGTANVTSLVNLCPTPQLSVTVIDANGCNAVYDFMGIVCKQCDTLTTYSQSTWGDAPTGNNLASYLHANFNSAFPAGLTIGCNNMLTLTNAQAITDWLPTTGTPAILSVGTLTDDTNYNNGFAAQLVTAKLNVGFDAYDPNFNPSSDYLGNRFFTSGLYAGYTVDQVIEEASNVIGGCVPNYSLAELNFALNVANLNYEDGNHANGYLACRFINPIRYTSIQNDKITLKSIYPNPCTDVINAEINIPQESDVKIEITDMLGRVLISNDYNLSSGFQKITINTKGLSPQVYLIRFTTENTACSSMIVVK